MAEGAAFAAATAAEVEAAERFRRMVPSAEVVRFTNTGSEATMLALRLARAHTRRRKFLKFEGHYHGWYDPYLLNAHSHPFEQLGPPENPARIPDSQGIPPSTFDDVVLAPWNDVAVLERILREHGGDLAAVITEPIMANMGCIPPRDGYLERLSQLTRDYGALLIFDEVVTGFRYAPGGCQEYYGITPDMTTMAKILAGGLPGGAIGGRADIMSLLEFRADPQWMRFGRISHPGTYNANPLSAAAGVACLKVVREPAVQLKATETADKIRAGFDEVLKRRGVNGKAGGEVSLLAVSLPDSKLKGKDFAYRFRIAMQM